MAQLTGDAKLWRGFFCTLLGGIGWGFSGACGQYLFLYQELYINHAKTNLAHLARVKNLFNFIGSS